MLPACLHGSALLAADNEPQRDWADELETAAAPAWDSRQQEEGQRIYSGQQQQQQRGGGQRRMQQGWQGGRQQQLGHLRNMFDYQRMANDVAAARKTFLIRDVMDEMLLNGLAPDRVFLELSITHCMRASRIGDCFYYYNEMQRRGMQPSSKLQGLLISVLSREGHLEAAEEAFYKMNQNTAPDAFELQLALVNAYGEVGDVDKCSAHLKEMLARNPQIGALVTWGYNAILKGYRKATNVDQIPDFPQRVLAAMREGQEAQKRLEPDAETWAMPSYALFALQKQGFHKECVELWESLPPESKLHPESWAYNHIVMSYVKDGMGILRWPKNEKELKRRIKDIFLREREEAMKAEAERMAAESGAAVLPAEFEFDSDSDSEQDANGSPNDNFVGPAGQAEFANRISLPKWVPRSDYSRLRFQVLAQCASLDSWQKALAYHKEMNSHGMELPPSELIEFVEAALQMECMGFSGCMDVAMDLMERFTKDQNAHLPGNQKRFINPNIGSQLLRFASQRSVSNLEVAHRIWDVLLEQGSRASRVAMRGYLIALQRRDPDNPRMAEVVHYGREWHQFMAKPELYKSMNRDPTDLPADEEDEDSEEELSL
ncbi:g7699 [Coccomyxa viridis]|uniref:G7699 protein n=1 Tax=Coccomyxa viridis TaxID=1274662 RepID=A0ABP1FYI1_9CHLO